MLFNIVMSVPIFSQHQAIGKPRPHRSALELVRGACGQSRLVIGGFRPARTAYSHAVRKAGGWSVRLLTVTIEGVDAPIVLVNEDRVATRQSEYNADRAV
jgi:hypothetical protein